MIANVAANPPKWGASQNAKLHVKAITMIRANKSRTTKSIMAENNFVNLLVKSTRAKSICNSTYSFVSESRSFIESTLWSDENMFFQKI